MKGNILERAKELGYSMTAYTGDRKIYMMYHPKKKINLDLYPDTEEFELSFMYGIIIIKTGKCGSFMLQEHFNKIEALLLDVSKKIRDNEKNH